MREWLAEWTTRERRLAAAVAVLAVAVLSLFAYILWGERSETTWMADPSVAGGEAPTLPESGEPQGGAGAPGRGGPPQRGGENGNR